MRAENRWHRAKFEASGQPCEVVAVYNVDAEEGRDLLHLLLADGRKLTSISQGRYQTLWSEVVVSKDVEAP